MLKQKRSGLSCVQRLSQYVVFFILHSTAQRFISRDGTHKIEVSDIIIFMYSIQPSMHKTDTHNLFKKKIDQNTI